MFIILHLNVFSSQQKFASDKELEFSVTQKLLLRSLTMISGKSDINIPELILYYHDRRKYYPSAAISIQIMLWILSPILLGDSTQEVATFNPRDKVLYRTVNGDTS
jgi:hypothetical protein